MEDSVGDDRCVEVTARHAAFGEPFGHMWLGGLAASADLPVQVLEVGSFGVAFMEATCRTGYGVVLHVGAPRVERFRTKCRYGRVRGSDVHVGG